MSGAERWALRIAICLVFFEIPIVSVLRHLGAKAGFPNASLWLHPAAVLAITLVAISRANRAPGLRRSVSLALAMLLLYSAGLLISGVGNGSPALFYLPLVLLGPLIIAIMLINLSREALVDEAIKSLFLASVLWSAVFFLLYIWDWSVLIHRYRVLHDLSLSGIILNSKYPGDWADYSGTYFYRYLGNVNKQSNIVLISLILGCYLLTKGGLSMLRFAFSSIPALILILLLGSKATILLTAMLGVALFSCRHLRICDTPAVVLILTAPLVFVACNPTVRAAWFDSSSLTERIVIAGEAIDGAPGLSLDRPGKPVAKPLPAGPVWRTIFGYGAGLFGPTIGRMPEAGSHILFLDAWIEGGLLGAISLVLLFAGSIAYGLWRTFFRDRSLQALFGSIGMLTVMCLGLREYSLVYLFVQSVSAVLPAIFLCMIFSIGAGSGNRTRAFSLGS